MRFTRWALTLLVVIALGTIPAIANTINCTTATPPLSATASFTNTGSTAGVHTVTIVLTNDAACYAADPQQVLTALGFNYSGPTLTPVSATGSVYAVSTGAQVLVASNTDVGGNWQYKTGINFHGDNAGIGSSGLNGIFGGAVGFFSAAIPCGTPALDGLNCGILPLGDGSIGYNGATNIKSQGPLIWNSATFVLDYDCPAGGCGSLPTFTDILFQYGTAPDEFHFHQVPEPSALMLLGSGLIGLGTFVRKRHFGRS